MTREAVLAVLAGIVVLAAVPGSHLVAEAAGLDVRAVDAGVFATMVGLLAGAPLALLVARALNAEADRDRRDQLATDRSELLTLFREDLLETMHELVERDRGETVGRVLRTDLWEALSAGGRLELIDPELLGQVARAYHFVETTAYIERLQWEEYHSAAHWSRERGSGIVAITLKNAIRQLDPDTKSALDVALTRLSAALGLDPPLNLPLRPETEEAHEADG